MGAFGRAHADPAASAPAAVPGPVPQVFANGAAVADAPRAGVRSAQYAGVGPEAGDKAGRPPVVPQLVMPPSLAPIAPHPARGRALRQILGRDEHRAIADEMARFL